MLSIKRNTHVGLENSSKLRTFTVPSYHVLSKVHSYHVLNNTACGEKNDSLSIEIPSGYTRTMCLIARLNLNSYLTH